MSEVLIVLLSILAVGALIKLHTAFWRRYFSVDRFADQVHFAITEDGWRIAIHHYLPAIRRFREPVVLSHGMGANRFNYDMADDRSLARYLCARGFDVWSLELRGSGMSSRPGWCTPYTSKVDFDDHLFKDVPAALALVRNATGGGPVFWVGHSMGGMLGYAWLGLRGEHGLAGLVTLCAPVQLGASKLHRRYKPLLWLLALWRVVAFRPVARFFSPLVGWRPRLLTRVVSTDEGIEGPMLRRCMVSLVENSTGQVLRQYLRWARRNVFQSRTGEEDYLSNLGRIREPVLILASDADVIVPADSVAPAYQHLGSEDKQLRVFGTDRGDDYDFGHVDVLLGRHAQEFIYPEIAHWLDAHATEQKAGS